MIPSTKGSKIYAAVKGISDSGIKIKYDEKIMPTEDKIKNNLEESEFNKIKEAIEKKK